jgi:hypothetical protein
MTKLILFLLILIAKNINAQDIVKKYDKVENKNYLSFADDFDLTIDNNSETLDFDMNLLKVYDSNDTNYFVKLKIEALSNLLCSSIESKCVFKFDKETIYLKPINYDKKKGSFKKYIYIFDLPINKIDLIKLGNSKKITIKYICIDEEMKGVFDEDEIIELYNFVKQYVQ